MTPLEKAREAYQSWYDSLPRQKAGAPAKGSIAVGLVVLDRLKSNFDLELRSHLAPGGAQLQGVSGAAVRKILRRFGETRPFTDQGGRTNRGSPAIAAGLLEAMNGCGLAQLAEPDRNEILTDLQGRLVAEVRAFHGRERLKPVYDPAESTRRFIGEVLSLAEENGKRGPVAQYLVGAKLQLRYPDAEVRNESYSAADVPTGQPGDFVLGDTAFHVTVAPTPAHYEKCPG